VEKQSPTSIGDVLILRTSVSYTVYAVGTVSTTGQDDFSRTQQVFHVSTRDEAIRTAKAMVSPHGRIHLLDIDTSEWSQIETDQSKRTST
jgi:hypothetical protein